MNKNKTISDKIARKSRKSHKKFLNKFERLQKSIYSNVIKELGAVKSKKVSKVKRAIDKTLEERGEILLQECVNDIKDCRKPLIQYIKNANYLSEEQKNSYIARYDNATKENFVALISSMRNKERIESMKSEAAKICYSHNGKEYDPLRGLIRSKKEGTYSGEVINNYNRCMESITTEFHNIVNEYNK